MKRYIKSAICNFNDVDIESLSEYASSSDISPEELTELAVHPHSGIRRDVAQNPNTPLKILRKLSFDESSDVRAALLRNPNVTDTIVKRLAFRSGMYFARKQLADDPTTPNEDLRQLCHQKLDGITDFYIKWYVYNNPNASEDLKSELVDFFKSIGIDMQDVHMEEDRYGRHSIVRTSDKHEYRRSDLPDKYNY